MLVAWATLAIYYSNLPWTGLRLGLAGAFAAFSIWALWLSHQRRMPFAIPRDVPRRGRVVDLHQSIARSPWRPEVAVMPRAVIDGDRVRITGVRNFDYR